MWEFPSEVGKKMLVWHLCFGTAWLMMIPVADVTLVLFWNVPGWWSSLTSHTQLETSEITL